jgi:anaphase-promoting complex subunit 2
MQKPISNFNAHAGDLDWDNIEWTPAPIDADPEYRAKSEDVMAYLLSLYDREDFINELKSILGEHLLRSESNSTFESETRLLELFKHRLGEDKLQACEVMLHDVETSRRINTAVHRSDFYHGTILNAQLNAQILSSFFWPSLRDDTFAVPEPIAALQEQYAKAFSSLKAMRKLEWLPALGRVDVELELEDRRITETVPPWVASVIYAFNSEDGREVTKTAEQLEDQLQMDESFVRSSLIFWMSKHVLRESSPQTYTVIERLSDTDSRASINEPTAAQIAEAEAVSSIKTQQDVFDEKAEMYKTFITGMLTNQGNMDAMRIQMMLKIVFPGGFPFGVDELKQLLTAMVDEGKLVLRGDIYGVKK